MRLLLVEDQVLVASAWRRWLERAGWSVDHADSLRSARALLRRRAGDLDVVVLDLQLPDGDGTALLPAIDEHCPGAAIVVASGTYAAEHALRLQGRCDAVVPKPVDGDVLLQIVGAVVLGARQRACVARFAAHHRLSPAETRLLHLAAAGHDNHEIAEALGCKRGSVTTYWKRVFRKTGCRSQRGVLAALIRMGLGGPPDAVGGGRAPKRGSGVRARQRADREDDENTG